MNQKDRSLTATPNAGKGSLPAFRLIAAPFTPMDERGGIRHGDIASMAGFLTQRGVTGVFVNGTTGEGLSLTLDERKRLVGIWREQCAGRLELIVHVGHSCPGDAGELAAHAESLGVAAIAALGPVFYGVSSPEVLARYCAPIAAAAPHTPFYYYHMPSMTRVDCRASEILPAMVEMIPTFRGIKFTHNDLEDYSRCIKIAAGRYEIFFGRDELLLEGLQRGARSAVGSTYNFAAPLYQEIHKAFAAGDGRKARSLQELVTSAIDIMVQCGGMSGIKACMGLAGGLDCGGMRLPLQSLDVERREVLRSELERLGYWAALESAMKS